MIRTRKERFAAGEETWWLGELPASEMQLFVGTLLPELGTAADDPDAAPTSSDVRRGWDSLASMGIIVGRCAFRDEAMTDRRFELPEADTREAAFQKLGQVVMDEVALGVLMACGTRCLDLNGLGKDGRATAAAFRHVPGDRGGALDSRDSVDVRPAAEHVAPGIDR